MMFGIIIIVIQYIKWAVSCQWLRLYNYLLASSLYCVGKDKVLIGCVSVCFQSSSFCGVLIIVVMVKYERIHLHGFLKKYVGFFFKMFPCEAMPNFDYV
jgi:hypothetical protein